MVQTWTSQTLSNKPLQCKSFDGQILVTTMFMTYLLFSCLVSTACGSELATRQTQTSAPSQPSQIPDQHDNSEAKQVLACVLSRVGRAITV